ncbi:MAG: hypothetical protein ACRDF4_00460, partial [Rhabdochlamydiaceae bacterium]
MLRKRLKELDTAKADPREVSAVADALEKLEIRLEKQIAHQKERQLAKEKAQQKQESPISETAPLEEKFTPEATPQSEQPAQTTMSVPVPTPTPTPVSTQPEAVPLAASTEKESDRNVFALDSIVEPIKGAPGSWGVVMRHDNSAADVFVLWQGGKLKDEHVAGAYSPKDLRTKASLKREAGVDLYVDDEHVGGWNWATVRGLTEIPSLAWIGERLAGSHKGGLEIKPEEAKKMSAAIGNYLATLPQEGMLEALREMEDTLLSGANQGKSLKVGSLKEAEVNSHQVMEDVLEGWNDNFGDMEFEIGDDVLDMLSNLMSEKSWGDQASLLYESDNTWRSKLEKALITQLLAHKKLKHVVAEEKKEEVKPEVFK